MKWTLDQLRTFLAVHDAGSLAAAAHQRGYTPGAVSQQLTNLETAVGHKLLVRAKTGVEFTDYGARLLPAVREMLAAEAAAALDMTTGRPIAPTMVRLGVFGSIAVAALGSTAIELARAAPHVRLQAVEVDVERMPEAVLDRQVDVALGLQYPDAPFAPQRGLDATILARERFMIIADRKWGVSDIEDVVARQDELPWILPPASSSFGRAVRVICGRAGLAPVEEHIVTDTAVTLALVEAGFGLSMATPLMLQLRPLAHGTVKIIVSGDREIVAFSRASAGQRLGITMVRDSLVRAFA